MANRGQAIKVATAWVELTYTSKGVKSKIAEDVARDSRGSAQAFDAAGKAAGNQYVKGYKSTAMPGTDKATKETARASRNASVAMAGFGAAVGAGALASVRALGDIGAAWSEVDDTIRIGTGLTGEALEGVQASARNIAGSVPADLASIGDTVANLNTRLGATGPTLDKLSKQFLEAGRLQKEALDVSSTTALFNSFGIGADRASEALDNMFRVSQATGISMNNLAARTQPASAALARLGFSFEDSIALIGGMEKAGLRLDTVVAAMGAGAVNMAKAGEKPAEAIQRTLKQLKLLIDAGKQAEAIDLASGIFGAEGANQLVTAMEKGVLSANDMLAATGATNDSILELGQSTKTMADYQAQFASAMATAFEPVGEELFAALASIAEGMLPVMQSLGQWMKDNPALTKAIVIGVLAFAAALAVGTAAMAAFNLVAALNPFVLIGLAIVALVAYLAYLWYHWDEVTAWIVDNWTWFFSVVGGGWNAIVALWQSAIDGLVSYIRTNWGALLDATVAIWTEIVNFVSAAPSRIFESLTQLSVLAAKAMVWFGGLKSSAVLKIGELVAWLGGIPGRIIGVFAALGGRLGQSGYRMIMDFLGGIKRAWGQVTAYIAQGMARVRGYFPFSPAKFGPFAGTGYVTYSAKALVDDFAQGLVKGVPIVGQAAESLTTEASAYFDGSAASAKPLDLANNRQSATNGGVHVTVNNPIPEPASRSLADAAAKLAGESVPDEEIYNRELSRDVRGVR